MPAVTRTDKQALLATTPLFAPLAPGDLEALAGVATSLRLETRKELFHKGDPGSQVYLVVDGRLKVLATSVLGDDVVFNVITPGEVIGEVALLTGSPRTATIVAMEPCELIVIDRRDFLAFLRSHAEADFVLLEILALRLKGVSELVEDTQFLNLPLRLAKKLSAFAREHGEETQDGVRINLKMSQEEWGDLVGATRESINKQLRGWIQQGVISVEKGYVTIHRFDELERLTQQVFL